ncbi:TPA: phage head closure protein [Streptococcus suis]|uniref:phage head closure protein n=1 Tax=Streptococcus suis TaxID=1307 RepID=UPI001557D7FE|nr:phage head closure protein [Streptococcus suis]HEL1738459.1 phage head closure protein [Streptococcus suis]HEL1739370.1 phage head closure protein [Streptococcus suis]HEL2045658.1 phage head closure protein [Streptococcus suis]HEL2171806.1 phage head closure protein [Streptococcus suis]
MRIAPLRERVTFYQRQIAMDDIGNESSSFQELFSRWCSVRLLSESESNGAASIKTDQRVRFTLRYDPLILSLDTKMTRLIYQNQLYNITLIDGMTYPREIILVDASKEDSYDNHPN